MRAMSDSLDRPMVFDESGRPVPRPPPAPPPPRPDPPPAAAVPPAPDPVVPPAPPPDAATAGPASPMIFESDEEGRIASRTVPPLPSIAEAPPEPGLRPSRVALLGLGVLVVGLLLIDLSTFVAARFAQSPLLGWLTLLVVASGVGGIGWWIASEVRAVLRLKSVAGVQQRFDGRLDRLSRQELDAAVAAVTDSLGSSPRIRLLVRAFELQRQPHDGAARTAALFEDMVLRPLDTAADNAVWRAVRDVFGMTALSPSSLIDSLAFIARALRLVRDVAEVYGHRPGIAGTRYLVRRILIEASVSGVSSSVSTMVSRMLGHWSAKLVGEVATAGLSAQRMHRIGRLAVAACRPIRPPGSDADGDAADMPPAPPAGR